MTATRTALHVLAAGILCLWLGCDRFALPGAGKPSDGFRIDSIPAGARVRVDGHLRGKTPLALTDLPAGVVYQLRLELAGFEAWETHVAFTSGQFVELPRAALARIDPDAEDDARMPSWPRQPGLPADLLVVVKEFYLGWHSDTTLRALGPESAEVTLGAGEHSHLTCTYRIGPSEIARFNWNEFVDVVAAGRARQSKRWCTNREICYPLDVTIRAGGHTLSAQATEKHRIEFELKNRLDAVTRGLDPWPREPIIRPIARLDAALTSCLARPALSTLRLAIAQHTGRLRVLSLDESLHTAQELACIQNIIASSTLPASSSCELHLELPGYALSLPTPGL